MKFFSKKLATYSLLSGLIGGVLAVALAVPGNPPVEARQAYRNDSLIRLHVIANSDSPADQELKLAVRDAVMKMIAGWPMGKTLIGTRQTLSRGLSQIEAEAIKVVKEWGENYPVAVQFGEFDFPARAYGDLVLPSGRYETLRVVIGSGLGENWWCVLFPPLCLVDISARLVPPPAVAVMKELPDWIGPEPEQARGTGSDTSDSTVKERFQAQNREERSTVVELHFKFLEVLSRSRQHLADVRFGLRDN